MSSSTSKFDLALSIGELRGADGSPGGLAGTLEYATDLFERVSVEALVERLVRLLEGAVASPDASIGSLDILEAAERHRIVEEWNATARAGSVGEPAGAVRVAGGGVTGCGCGCV